MASNFPVHRIPHRLSISISKSLADTIQCNPYAIHLYNSSSINTIHEPHLSIFSSKRGTTSRISRIRDSGFSHDSSDPFSSKNIDNLTQSDQKLIRLEMFRLKAGSPVIKINPSSKIFKSPKVVLQRFFLGYQAHLMAIKNTNLNPSCSD